MRHRGVALAFQPGALQPPGPYASYRLVMRWTALGLGIVALLTLACSSDGRAGGNAFEVRAGATLFANDERVSTFSDWRDRVHIALPAVELPAGLVLVNAYTYRPDADLDLSLVSLFFEDTADAERWLLLKFDDRAAFPLLAATSTVVSLGRVEGRVGVYVNGAGEPWHDLVFEACSLGVAVKSNAEVWAREEVEAVARSIVEGCESPRGPAAD